MSFAKYKHPNIDKLYRKRNWLPYIITISSILRAPSTDTKH